MGRNVEIKARLRNPAAVQGRVETLADTGPERLEQVDTFYPCREGRLKLRRLSSAEGELIHYLRPDAPGPKQSSYSLVPVTEPEALARILGAALGTLGEVRKTRLLYRKGRTRIHLDQVEELGSFLELEVVLAPDQGAMAGEKEARSILQRLGVESGDLVAGAYLDLLTRAGEEPSGHP